MSAPTVIDLPRFSFDLPLFFLQHTQDRPRAQPEDYAEHHPESNFIHQDSKKRSETQTDGEAASFFAMLRNVFSHSLVTNALTRFHCLSPL